MKLAVRPLVWVISIAAVWRVLDMVICGRLSGPMCALGSRMFVLIEYMTDFLNIA